MQERGKEGKMRGGEGGDAKKKLRGGVCRGG